MSLLALFALVTITLIGLASAAPSRSCTAASKRQSITALSSSQISAFRPFTFFASAAYCQPTATINWSCGANCNANSGFQPTASGGDGTDTQFWYVGFDPALNTVIVAHQGTDPDSLLSLSVDANAILESPAQSLFPGLPSNIEIHSGFASSHSRTASSILTAVQATLTTHSASNPSVTLVGHSLGAALSMLDAVYLPLQLPSGTQFRFIGYGVPRVGNQAFADYVDAHVTSLDGGAGLTRINNKEDPIPINPGIFLGYHHPSGEVHIQDSGAWDACPGQDNDSPLCSRGDVSSDFDGELSNHDGPYDGIVMGC